MDIDFEGLREKMVDGQLRTTDVTDRALLSAFFDVPREEFVPAEKRPVAYIDEDLPLLPSSAPGGARYLMEPSPLAKLMQLAEIGPDDVVLDVGCVTGYAAAVLSRIASSVIAVECDQGLADKATETLSRLGYDNVVVIQGALEEGYAAEAPYDVILLEGAVDAVPEALFDQLKDGGRLVAVEGHGNAGVARIYVKDGGVVAGRRVFNAAVRPLPGFQRAPAFEF